MVEHCALTVSWKIKQASAIWQRPVLVVEASRGFLPAEKRSFSAIQSF